MFRADVTTEDILSYEPRLSEYIKEGNSDFSTEIARANDRVTAWLKSKRFLLRKLCLPYNITEGEVTTSDDDTERLRLVIDISSSSSSDSTITLKGTNDAGETYSTIFTLDIPADTTGETTKAFSKPYKRYLIELVGDITATYFLTERSFELPVIYIAISIIMRSLSMGGDSIWSSKSQEYEDLAFSILQEFSFGYDADDNGSYDNDERYTLNEITVKA